METGERLCAELIIHRWQPQQTRPLPDLTTQIEGQRWIMRTDLTDANSLVQILQLAKETIHTWS